MIYTTLVNKNNIFKENYLNKIELVKYKDIDNNDILVENKTLESYLKLKDYLLTKNIEIGIDSAYRTISYQEELRERLLKEEGEEYVKNYVALPNNSEHLTGLAIDIAIKINGEYNSGLKEEKEYKIIHSSIHKFGFILRYPERKEDITGYSYEPWHIRYVGLIPAKIIFENKLTLEEYLTNFGCVLYINKPKNITSFDVVHEIKKLFGIKKVGHTGTLDPIATGVMLITVGKATKIVELLTANDKEYIAGVKLGIKTDTYDITGQVIEENKVPENINLKKVIKSFKKTYLQEVPIYSAVKVNGKKLYKYAREDKEISLPKKKVTIKEIELLTKENNNFTFRTLVSKGCYIRSLIMDIAKELNTYGTMTSLVRTKQGIVSINQTNTLEDIKNNHFKLHKIEEVLPYPVVVVKKEEEKFLSNGVSVENKWHIEDKVIFHTIENQIIGIYEKEGELLKVWKNFR